MPPPTSPPLLDETLKAVARRYWLPPVGGTYPETNDASAATALAMAIEQARLAMAGGMAPGTAPRQAFVDALARMVREAMRPATGDPVFQAMVLRHRTAHVREYASLSARAEQDRRQVHAAVNAAAHPKRPRPFASDGQREALARLHASAASSSWEDLADAARCLLGLPELAHDAAIQRGLARLLDSPALQDLRRLDSLASDPLVLQYRSLWDRHGPRQGSASATAQGVASRQRGAAAEASATLAIEALARRLNAAEGVSAPDCAPDRAPDRAPYRVVTSLRVPASIPASHERAKTEWDVVLLRRRDAEGWDVCLLVEVKASVDAATTDFPRLLRGLRLLAHADASAVYAFETRQGTIRLHGASLRTLPTGEAGLAATVLYCCDAPAEAAPRLLGAASRMQLLSAPATLAFAGALADTQPADPSDLEPLWDELLASPTWGAVLHQLPMLRAVRDLMVHTDDLLAALPGTPVGHAAR